MEGIAAAVDVGEDGRRIAEEPIVFPVGMREAVVAYFYEGVVPVVLNERAVVLIDAGVVSDEEDIDGETILKGESVDQGATGRGAVVEAEVDAKGSGGVRF